MRMFDYVDGFNRLYGALKGTRWKWLDLPALFAKVLQPHHDVLARISHSEWLIKAELSAISVVYSITYRSEGTRPYERRVCQNKADFSGSNSPW